MGLGIRTEEILTRFSACVVTFEGPCYKNL